MGEPQLSYEHYQDEERSFCNLDSGPSDHRVRFALLGSGWTCDSLGEHGIVEIKPFTYDEATGTYHYVVLFSDGKCYSFSINLNHKDIQWAESNWNKEAKITTNDTRRLTEDLQALFPGYSRLLLRCLRWVKGG